jgi:hypothetical protein
VKIFTWNWLVKLIKFVSRFDRILKRCYYTTVRWCCNDRLFAGCLPDWYKKLEETVTKHFNSRDQRNVLQGMWNAGRSYTTEEFLSFKCVKYFLSHHLNTVTPTSKSIFLLPIPYCSTKLSKVQLEQGLTANTLEKLPAGLHNSSKHSYDLSQVSSQLLVLCSFDTSGLGTII